VDLGTDRCVHAASGVGWLPACRGRLGTQWSVPGGGCRDDFEVAAEAVQEGRADKEFVEGSRGAVGPSSAGEKAGEWSGNEIVVFVAGFEAGVAEKGGGGRGREAALIWGLITGHQFWKKKFADGPGEAVAAGIERVKYSAGREDLGDLAGKCGDSIGQVMQEEYRDDDVERSVGDLGGVEGAFDEIDIVESCGVQPGLADGGGREVESGEMAYMLGEQDFGVADATTEAEDAGGLPRSGDFEDAADHVFAESADGGLGEVGLREARVEFLVILDFALKWVRSWQEEIIIA